ncbi:MAG: GAF domain-containing protein, partial [Halobaculum sp.]
LYAVPGIGITLQQRTLGLPILNADVLIAQMWLGGSLLGLAVGHLYGRAVVERTRLKELLGATEELMGGTDAESIAESTIDAAERILGLDTSGVYTPSDETTMEALAITDQSVEFFGRVPTIDSRDAIAWSAFEAGETISVDDVRTHSQAYNPDTPVRSELYVPFGDTGVFMAASAETGAFDETDLVLAELLVSNAEAAFESVTNAAKLRERERKLERLQDRSRELMYTEGRTETGRVAVEAARNVIGASLNGLHLLDESGETLEAGPTTETARDLFGEPPDYHRDHDDGSSDEIVWNVFESGEPLYVEDTYEYEPLSEEPLSRCLLIYPIGEHGVFIASSKEPADFDETDRVLFNLLSSMLRSAFDRVDREQTLRRREETLERHRQRLTVLNRVLRHDIRTHTNVIMGRATQLSRETDGTVTTDVIESKAEKIVELSENARRVEQTIETDNQVVETVDLTTTIENCAGELRSSTSVDVRVDLPDSVFVLSNGLLDVAVENILRNAVEHNDSDRPRVEIRARIDSEERVVIEIADNGPGIPPSEREVFEQDRETKLVHSSGLGLWLVHWIVEDIDGTVEFDESSRGGTVVRLHLPQAVERGQSERAQSSR